MKTVLTAGRVIKGVVQHKCPICGEYTTAAALNALGQCEDCYEVEYKRIYSSKE